MSSDVKNMKISFWDSNIGLFTIKALYGYRVGKLALTKQGFLKINKRSSLLTNGKPC